MTVRKGTTNMFKRTITNTLWLVIEYAEDKTFAKVKFQTKLFCEIVALIKLFYSYNGPTKLLLKVWPLMMRDRHEREVTRRENSFRLRWPSN